MLSARATKIILLLKNVPANTPAPTECDLLLERGSGSICLEDYQPIVLKHGSVSDE